MRSASCSSLHLHTLPFPHRRQRPPLRTAVNFLPSSSSSLVHGAGADQRPSSSSSDLLPVVVRKSGRDYRYKWDGARLALVPYECQGFESSPVWDRFQELLRLSCSALRRLFVPHKVQPNYLLYLKWKLLHRIFSSALQVLATQALFRAIGFGSSRSLSSAAALNWMLKDGLGRFSRCIYTASLGAAFDTNLKPTIEPTSTSYNYHEIARITPIRRYNLSLVHMDHDASYGFDLSVGVELMTPVFPQHFLLLATVANIAKSISLASYIATGSAIHRSFAVADNLGEVSAKAQIQIVCFDMMGLILAATLNAFCKDSQRFQAVLPFFVYPIFSAIDLFAIYQGLKHVHLQTLTKDRLEIIIERWIHTGLVPSPADVSKSESIFPKRLESKLWPARIGAINPRDLSPEISMMTMKLLKEEAHFFICMETFHHLMQRHWQHGIVLSLHEDAGTTDIIAGLLQVCHARQLLLACRFKWEHRLVPCSTSTPALMHWLAIAENSRKCALQDVHQLTDDIQRAGWAVKNILLTAQEQIRYNLVGE